MAAELNLLDWLFSAGQALFGVSFIYFLYLLIRHSQITPIILNGLLRRFGMRPYRPSAPNDRYLLME